MPDSHQTPWSNHPDAPKISRQLYIQEKGYFISDFIGSILYGLLVVLFFRCITALFNPTYRRGRGIKWGLVSYTTIVFLVGTVVSGMDFNIKSDSYINNREFRDAGDVLPPGPLGYRSSIFSDVPMIVFDFMFFLNGWLANGLLLYRCYVIYSMNLWVVALPCLMYLGSLGTYWSPYKLTATFRANAIDAVTGILYQVTRSKDVSYSSVVTDFGFPHLSISVSLNVLLTLMIIVRLILHTRNIRTVMGITGIGGLSKAIVTILIESCALYATSSLLVIVPWVAGYHDVILFLPILSQTQDIALLLVIQRVVNASALTKNADSGRLSSFKGEFMGDNGAPASGIPTSSVDVHAISGPGELVAGIGTTVDLYRDET